MRASKPSASRSSWVRAIALGAERARVGRRRPRREPAAIAAATRAALEALGERLAAATSRVRGITSGILPAMAGKKSEPVMIDVSGREVRVSNPASRSSPSAA